MKRINLAAAIEWDDLELLEADAGRFLMGSPSDEDLASYRRISANYPRIELVEVITGRDCFSVAPSPDQAHNQLAYGSLYRIARDLGWNVSNIVKRFDPFLAADVARRYGLNRLGYKNSWLKVTIPAALRVNGAEQPHRDSVRYLIEAMEDGEPVMSIQTFLSLSARSIAKTMSPGEAAQYLEAMGVSLNALGS